MKKDTIFYKKIYVDFRGNKNTYEYLRFILDSSDYAKILDSSKLRHNCRYNQGKPNILRPFIYKY
jgi:hypothetical protein